MASLHIEHPITDLKTWATAFAAFTDTRRQAGVRAETVRCPEDDESFVIIDLEFDTTDQAKGFLHFLETMVWAVPANSPALAGTPVAKILKTVEFAAYGSQQPSLTRKESA